MSPIDETIPDVAMQSHQFEDNALLQTLFGPNGVYLEQVGRQMGVKLSHMGNVVIATGPLSGVQGALAILEELYQRLSEGRGVDEAEIDSAIRMSGQMTDGGKIVYATRKRRVEARTPGQGVYMKAMEDYPLVFGVGPAGTGKTYLAVAKAVSMMIRGEVDRIILSRPAVEAGERLGFLPGDLRDKIDPYLRPLYDALHDMLPGDQVAKRLASGDIEVAPLAFMRGRTLGNAFVILDEAQNATPMQMKMFLTRLGGHSRMVVTGDLSQVDLPNGARSGLSEALDILTGVEGIGVVRFSERDVVRHPLVARIVSAYDRAALKT